MIAEIIQAKEKGEEVKVSEDGSESNDEDIPLEQPPPQLIEIGNLCPEAEV